MHAEPNSPTAFSYIRFSSRKQEEGDSLRRQVELTTEWAKRNNIHLDTSLEPDRGVSAFRGKNQDIGALGAFLRLVESGRVLAGSYLIVESLDRLTREEIQPALLLVLSLLQKGIKIVQLKPVEQVYDSKSDTTPIILMLVELSRAHSESKVKSERLSAAWDQRRKSARAGEDVFTRKLPLWVEEKDGELIAIPERAAAVRRIFALSVSGLGMHAIMSKLNEENVLAFGPSGRWSVPYIQKILKDRRAIGEFQPRDRKRKANGDPIPNYFPAIVTEEQWERSRMGARQRHNKPGRIGGRVNVFQGLVKNARDGHSYVTGSKSAKNPYPILRAAAVRIGAGGQQSFPLDIFEQAVLSQLRELDPHEILNGETRDESVELATKLRDVENQISAIEAALVNVSGDVPALVRAVQALESQRRELAIKLAEARQTAAHPLSESWGEAKSLLAALESAPDQREARLKLREALRRIVDEIWVLVVPRERDRLVAVQVWFASSTGATRHRDYLIHRRLIPRDGEGRRVARGGSYSVISAPFSDSVGEIDLRKRPDARLVESVLEELDVDRFGG